MTPREEAIHRLQSAHAIAILLGDAPDWDALGATVALARALKQAGKSVSIFTARLPTPLPPMFPVEDLTADPAPPRDFIISFDILRSPIKELRYERAENRLNIILSPQGGALRREDVEFRSGPFAYDLVVTLGVPEIRAIEPTIGETPELLHESTLLNIDYRAENTRYGDLNVVDPQAGSLSEIVSRLLGELGVAIAPDVATALLAGMAEAVGPLAASVKGLAAMKLASELLDAGADAGAVARALQARRDPGVIRLLGRALARSRSEPETGSFWALLTREDFLATGRGPQDVAGLLGELDDIVPGANVRILLWENPADGRVRVNVGGGRALAHSFPADGEPFASFAEAEGVIRPLIEPRGGDR